MKCTDCNGTEMVAGIVIDKTGSHATPSNWLPGDSLNVSFWTGQFKAGDPIKVTAYRCPECGLVKLYARDRAW
jgi:uncharacterized Zn finger protein